MFKHLSAQDIDAALLLANGSYVTYSANECVIDRFERDRALVFVTEGELHVYGGRDCQILMNTLCAGSCYGASTLFSAEEDFPTRIVAHKSTTVWKISEERISDLLRAYPQITINYISFLSDRIRFLNKRVDALTARSAESKVAAFLLSHSDGNGGLESPLNMSEIAAALGIGRASFYRILDSFAANGDIEGRGHLVKIKNKSNLERISKS
ncbi:MAG: Crp/Fnr family transcriptional regulator [Clostridia bacterium]|nr:Crp/Fnr family transcriptional regulator [Clostridia bacterium]